MIITIIIIVKMIIGAHNDPDRSLLLKVTAMTYTY